MKSERKRQRLHELQINTKQQLSNYQFEGKMYLHSLMIVHVRWPAKNSGAFVFGLNFWFFWFKPKEQKKISIMQSELFSFSLDGKRKFKDKRMAPPVCPANAHEESI
jgi:hypothetical protein